MSWGWSRVSCLVVAGKAHSKAEGIQARHRPPHQTAPGLACSRDWPGLGKMPGYGFTNGLLKEGVGRLPG